MAGNKALAAANKAKNDEFYTQLSDIENELRHYKEHFKGKTVLCNCDDPYESNFFKYFAINFNHLGLKKLICTCYAGSPVMYTQLSFFGDEEIIGKPQTDKKPYKIEITEVNDLNNDGAVDLTDIDLLLKSVNGKPQLLKGDGDFRSEECIELMKQADIVVTNPPFSLFRKYIALLIEHNMQFLIIGSQNNISYKDIYTLFQNNKLWLGHTSPKEFIVPKETQDRNNTYVRYDGKIVAKFGNICWFTNLDIKKRHEEIVLYKQYSPSDYPKYVNYDAIDVNPVSSIPCDYYDAMGVPITFLDKYNPEQFEIVGFSLELALPMKSIVPKGTYMTGGNRFYTQKLTPKDIEKGYLYHREYDRIVIKRKEKKNDN